MNDENEVKREDENQGQAAGGGQGEGEAAQEEPMVEVERNVPNPIQVYMFGQLVPPETIESIQIVPRQGYELVPGKIPQPRPEIDVVREDLKRAGETLDDIWEESLVAPSMAMTVFHRRKIEKAYEEALQNQRDIVAKLETRIAELRDRLNEQPEDAAQRDGIAMKLLDF